MENEIGADGGSFLATLGGGIVWFFQNLVMGVYNIFYATTHPSSWLDCVVWTGTV